MANQEGRPAPTAPGVIAEAHQEVTVLFADVVDFTPFTERTSPALVVGLLDDIFSAFDALASRHGLEKIKTIGDAYMVAAGLPEPRIDHAEAMAEMALNMMDALERLGEPLGFDLAIRVGIDSGPVIAGVIGRHECIYDLWGDTVNTASRMESHGLSGRVPVSEASPCRPASAVGPHDRAADLRRAGSGLARRPESGTSLSDEGGTRVRLTVLGRDLTMRSPRVYAPGVVRPRRGNCVPSPADEVTHAGEPRSRRPVESGPGARLRVRRILR
jgi:class 3 adenylate cyclase